MKIYAEERTGYTDKMLPVCLILVDEEHGGPSDLRKSGSRHHADKIMEWKYMPAMFCAQLTKIGYIFIRRSQPRL